MSFWGRIAGRLVGEGAHYNRPPREFRPADTSERRGRPLGEAHPEIFVLPAIEGTVWERARGIAPSTVYASWILRTAREVNRNRASVPAWEALDVVTTTSQIAGADVLGPHRRKWVNWILFFLSAPIATVVGAAAPGLLLCDHRKWTKQVL